MNKVYDQTKVEEKWYKFWNESGFFTPEINLNQKPYSIILPPPNANANLHFGHAMYVIEDILIRYHRMRGFATLWLPGADHAGFETQVVFEKNLAKEGKSRFDYDKQTLYQMIFDYVQKNKGGMEEQLRRLGFSLDWSREKFTLDEDIVKLVYQTFKKMFDQGIIYRAKRLINYCTKHGTGFSDLEVSYIERRDKLYFIKYPLTKSLGTINHILIATTRPETIFGDVAVAVNPKDNRYKNLLGKSVEVPLTKRSVKIIEDPAVDIEFGTGALKITPGHDILDYEIGQRNALDQITIIGFDGKMLKNAGEYAGLTVEEARKKVVEDLQKEGFIEKIGDYIHRVGTCYKCGKTIEPLLLEQWFLNVQDLKTAAVDVAKKGEIKIYPKNFETVYFQWLNDLRDWNISRQNIWGIRIPAWHCGSCGKWIATEGSVPEKCPDCPESNIEQDPDTFDTWFSSSQWPYLTLKTSKEGDFEKFYPTSVMETGYDILRAWVSRMVMMGLFITNEVPFKEVVLHGLVKDPLGVKMSKSKGNVVSPMEIVEQYGADAARMALVFGTALGHDQVLSHPKLQAMRNFTNKLWNIGRFIIDFRPENSEEEIDKKNPDDVAIVQKCSELTRMISESLDSFNFNEASEALYEFIWHEFADKYLEKVKERRAEAQPTLEYVFKTCLELLHPFMPFVTEELWQKLPHLERSIMIAKWPGET